MDYKEEINLQYIEKLDLQTEDVKEVENLEKHSREFLPIGGEYDDGFETVNETVTLGISCNVSKDVNNLKASLDTLESEVNELKEGNINVDLTDYATKDYVEDAIINAQLGGGDVQVDLSSYAKKTDLHEHSNKSIIDNITKSKVNQWDNKSDFSGSYNDLTNKPTIPTKTSELTNNSGFITSIPSEYVTETELSSHTSNTTAHITASERNNWNNKSNFDGNYNSLTNKPTSLPANGGNASTVGGYSLWVGTQAQYNAITTKSDTTVYIIKEE